MTTDLVVRCEWCSSECAPCEGCELVILKADRERLRQDNELLRTALAKASTEITTLWQRVSSMSSGITLRGWWCLKCSIFNGEEQSVHTHCRRCGIEKGK